MVKTNRSIILTVFLLSGVATAFLIVSLTTKYWVTANGKFINETDLSAIKYGLFAGTFSQAHEPEYEIKMTCLISDNACAYLCGTNAELRKSELKRLTKGENVAFNKNCPHVLKQDVTSFGLNDSINYKLKSGQKREFLNAGLYISTNIFLGISLLFGFLSTVVSVWILAANPIDISLSICAIYTYNIVAWIGSLVTLILWGILFRINILNNIGILYTIQEQMDTSDMVILGFSYWLILFSCLFYLITIVLVHIKQRSVRPDLETKILISG